MLFYVFLFIMGFIFFKTNIANSFKINNLETIKILILITIISIIFKNTKIIYFIYITLVLLSLSLFSEEDYLKDNNLGSIFSIFLLMIGLTILYNKNHNMILIYGCIYIPCLVLYIILKRRKKEITSKEKTNIYYAEEIDNKNEHFKPLKNLAKRFTFSIIATLLCFIIKIILL